MATLGVVFIAMALLYGAQPVASSPFGADAEVGDVASLDGPLAMDIKAESRVTGGDGGVLINAGGIGGAGVPVNARFTFGDPTAPIERPAFTITNTGDSPHDVALSYHGTTGDGPAEHVRFLVHDADGNRVTTLSEEDGRVVVDGVESGETLSFVVEVDTHGLTPAADLSGTFSAGVDA